MMSSEPNPNSAYPTFHATLSPSFHAFPAPSLLTSTLIEVKSTLPEAVLTSTPEERRRTEVTSVLREGHRRLEKGRQGRTGKEG